MKVKRFATMDREVVYVYKDYELYEDLSTGNIRITIKNLETQTLVIQRRRNGLH